MQIEFHSQTVGDVDVFYRVAAPADAPVVLLHGFPTASHMFRDLIPELAENYRVIAPDLPGFGNTEAPRRGEFTYSFDSLAQTIGDFTEALHLDRLALYVFDYGAPVGLRVAMAHPERITAIISQNGNAYLEGLSDAWAPRRPYRALAYQRDLPRAEVVLLEAGHFSLETHAAEIGAAMRHFLAAHGAGQPQ